MEPIKHLASDIKVWAFTVFVLSFMISLGFISVLEFPNQPLMEYKREIIEHLLKIYSVPLILTFCSFLNVLPKYQTFLKTFIILLCIGWNFIICYSFYQLFQAEIIKDVLLEDLHITNLLFTSLILGYLSTLLILKN